MPSSGIASGISSLDFPTSPCVKIVSIISCVLEVGNEIPFSLDKNLYRYLGASCQLYPSSNMRHIFKYAVDTKDFGLLVRKVREREEKIELVRGP
jgi:hypothetical protein